MHQRQQLAQPAERRQDALEPKQRREVRRVAAQCGEVDRRGLVELPLALQLEPLPDGLRSCRATPPKRGEGERRAQNEREASAVGWLAGRQAH